MGIRNRPPTVAVDLDGTILHFEESMWPALGEPLPHAKEAMDSLKEMGYHITIFTSRMCKMAQDNGEIPTQLPAIKAKLAKHDIPYDDIAMPEDGKIGADYYIDDKAIRFENNWPDVVGFIRQRNKE